MHHVTFLKEVTPRQRKDARRFYWTVKQIKTIKTLKDFIRSYMMVCALRYGAVIVLTRS